MSHTHSHNHNHPHLHSHSHCQSKCFLQRLQQLRRDLSKDPFIYTERVPLFPSRDHNNGYVSSHGVESEEIVVGRKRRLSSIDLQLQTQESSIQQSVLSGFRASEESLEQSAPSTPVLTGDNTVSGVSQSIGKTQVENNPSSTPCTVTVQSSANFMINTSLMNDQASGGNAYFKALKENTLDIMSHGVVFSYQGSGDIACLSEGEGGVMMKVCGCGDLVSRDVKH